MYSRAQIRALTLFSKLIGVPGDVWVSFVMPLARQFLFSFEAFRRPLVQDCCPMLSLFFRPYFNRGLGPIRVDPDDMPSYGSGFISLSFHISSMRSDSSVFQPGSLPQSSSRTTPRLGQATAGEPCADADRPAHDSPRIPDLPAGFPMRLPRRHHRSIVPKTWSQSVVLTP
jgi:hypothetical protein